MLSSKESNSFEVKSLDKYIEYCENNNYDGEIAGDYTKISNGSKKVIVTYGRIFSNAVEAVKQRNDIDVVKLNKIFPVSDVIIDLLKGYEEIHFFEEGVKSGGIGEHIGCRLNEIGFTEKYSVHAIEGGFVAADDVSSSLKTYGLDADSMISAFN